MDSPGDPWAFLREATPARIALGRSGNSLPTARVLEFQLAHARAQDAVHHPLDSTQILAALAGWDPILVESRAQNRGAFLQRPDLGRRLSPASAQKLEPGQYDATIVIADGLSAAAVEAHAARLCILLLEAGGRRFAPPVVAVQSRVALGDEIATGQGARMAIVLIGERPGLSACDSLGAYITFNPRPGLTKDAERNCVSNIHSGGLSINEAAQKILAIAHLACIIGETGTALKEDAALAALPPHGFGNGTSFAISGDDE
jgi:ethanolamine ammonia-lyase small subunit